MHNTPQLNSDRPVSDSSPPPVSSHPVHGPHESRGPCPVAEPSKIHKHASLNRRKKSTDIIRWYDDYCCVGLGRRSFTTAAVTAVPLIIQRQSLSLSLSLSLFPFHTTSPDQRHNESIKRSQTDVGSTRLHSATIVGCAAWNGPRE